MSIMDVIEISSQGMGAERVRLEVTASNIANVNTTRTPEGGPYKKKGVLFETKKINSFENMLDSELKENIKGVEAIDLITDNTEPIKKYDPQHPDSDEQGYVAYPNISISAEMVDMIAASRAYQANTSVFENAKTVVRNLIDLLRV